MSTRTEDNPNQFELSNGIRITLRDASPMLMVAMRKQADASEPTPPMITRSDRDGREEPNEDDPTYKAARAKWALELGSRALNILAAACVTVDHVPDGIALHDSDDWAALLTDVYGIEVEANPTRRMVQWLFLQTTSGDLELLGPTLLARAGAEEVAVQEVLDSFRSDGGGTTDSGRPTDGGRGDRDTLQTPVPGNRAERRRTRRG